MGTYYVGQTPGSKTLPTTGDTLPVVRDASGVPELKERPACVEGRLLLSPSRRRRVDGSTPVVPDAAPTLEPCQSGTTRGGLAREE